MGTPRLERINISAAIAADGKPSWSATHFIRQAAAAALLRHPQAWNLIECGALPWIHQVERSLIAPLRREAFPGQMEMARTVLLHHSLGAIVFDRFFHIRA